MLVPSAPGGTARVPVGTAAADRCCPTRAGVSVAPMPTAWIGPPLFAAAPADASSQRPSQPDEIGVCGDAVCQMDIERKWLWSGCG